MSLVPSILLMVCLAPAQLAASDGPAKPFTFHHEHVLGTALELQIWTESENEALAAETRVLSEIERLAKIFSTYDPTSEFSRWQHTINVATPVSQELIDVLAASDGWTRRSRGAFQPGIQVLSRVWSEAQSRDVLPDPSALQAAAARVNQPHWKLEPNARRATRLTDCPLTLNAIAKGAIVEWACQAACRSRAIHGLIVNLGGDLRVCGDAMREVAIADPRNDAENLIPSERIFVANRAVATSGDYRRGYTIAGRRYSHILDPRTGQPASEVISATIVTRSSRDADALATICNVLPAAEGLALIDSLPDFDGLLITRDGRRHPSAGWRELTAPGLFRFADAAKQLALADPPAKANDQPAGDVELLELLVKFELEKSEGAQYRRPYVAIWLEDADEFPVKTALLWMQIRQPGPRWHRDLLRWYRNEGERKAADGGSLIDTVSAATRGPGEYKVVFNGRDDTGQPLKPGKYTLFIEVVREHGTYQLIRRPMTLGSEPIAEVKLKSNAEVKSASVEYRRRPVAAEAGK